MKTSCYLLTLFFCLVSNVNAKLQTANHYFESELNVGECLRVSKMARSSIFKDKFGEIITSNTYDYLVDNVHISVSCITNKDLIIIFVATQDLEVLTYIDVLVEYFMKTGKVKNLE